MTLRYALRTLARDRAFAALAALTLALGIGANTAIFSLINGILLQSVPYHDPDQLVTMEESIPQLAKQYPAFPVNGRHFLEWRKRAKSFERIAAIDSRRMTLTGHGEPEQLAAGLVSANLFPMLGVQPRLGRNFLEQEDKPSGPKVVILTDGLWRRRFSANPNVVGQRLLLDGVPHLVVGILPPDFHFFKNRDLSSLTALEAHTDLFRPIAINIENIGPMGQFNYAVAGRLRPGVSREQALAELNVIQASISASLQGEDKADLRAILTPLKEQITGQSRRGLLVLLAAVGAVLLIVCVNLANLLLARALARRREAAIRAALGASAGDLIRHVLTEALLLSAVGGALGIAAAYWGVGFLVKTAPVDLPRLEEVHVDQAVLGFGVALALLTGVLSGVLPALRLARVEPAEALRSGGRAATESARGLRLRGLLVASEVALSAMLLIAAGLLLHSFVKLLHVDKGFNAASVIAADINLPAAKYKEDSDRVKFFDRLLPKIGALPGVRAAGLVSMLPLEGEGWADMISVVGQPQGAMFERPIANYRFVSPGYFAAIGIPLLDGRLARNDERKLIPALISSQAAKRVFKGVNPIGQRFRRGDDKVEPLEVVGVVGDVNLVTLQKPPGMMVYVPYWSEARMTFSLVARTTLDPMVVAPALRAAVREVDADVPLGKMRTLEQVVSHSVSPRRFQLSLVLLFAGAALLLASLGIYGVVSYLVTQRRNEIGIRMALGAAAGDVHRMILRQGMAPVLAGLAVGVSGALALSRLMSSLLFQVSPYDPAAFVGVTAALLLVAALACVVPSWRAARTDPSAVLRYE